MQPADPCQGQVAAQTYQASQLRKSRRCTGTRSLGVSRGTSRASSGVVLAPCHKKEPGPPPPADIMKFMSLISLEGDVRAFLLRFALKSVHLVFVFSASGCSSTFSELQQRNTGQPGSGEQGRCSEGEEAGGGTHNYLPGAQVLAVPLSSEGCRSGVRLLLRLPARAHRGQTRSGPVAGDVGGYSQLSA